MKNLIIVLFMLFIAISCKNSHEIPDNIKLFKYNEAAGIRSLDPAFAKDQANIWAVNQVFNGLVQLDDSLKVKPCIAKSWNISKNGKKYTFIIRNDIYFHESCVFKNKKRKLVSKDVEYTINRLYDYKTASPGKWVLSNVAEKNDKTLDIICENDTTLVINLKKPFAPFLSMLSMQYCYIVPKEAVDFYGKNFGRNPIGTGPFVFKYWKEGVKLILLKNKNYFELDSLGKKLPYIDGIVINFIIEKHTAFMEFMLGNFDMVSGIDPNYKDMLLDINGNLKSEHLDKISMTKVPYLNTEYIGILIGDKGQKQLQNKNLRLAINYGFDREKMIKYLRNNIGYPAINGIIPPALNRTSIANNKSFKYNQNKAKSFLNEAGFPNGEGLPEITLQTTATYQDLCEYIQRQLAEINININIDVVPPATLREFVSKSNSTFFRASWIADYPDAENYLALFYSKNKVPNGPNYTLFESKTFDNLYEKAICTQSDSQRANMYKEMNEIIMSEAPIVPIYYDVAIRFISNKIHGLKPNAMNLLVLKNVKKD